RNGLGEHEAASDQQEECHHQREESAGRADRILVVGVARLCHAYHRDLRERALAPRRPFAPCIKMISLLYRSLSTTVRQLDRAPYPHPPACGERGPERRVRGWLLNPQ